MPKRTTRKKSVANKTAKKTVTKKKAASKRLARKKKFSAKRKKVTSTGLLVGTVPLSFVQSREQRDGQSGDLQGIRNRPTADSESVEELLEEGNAFEAEAVQGVENALDADEGEVETREVPEDDVPKEYLHKDS